MSLQPGPLVPRLLIDQIDGSLINGHGITGGVNSDFPHDGEINHGVGKPEV
jgi:hypothetical protein